MRNTMENNSLSDQLVYHRKLKGLSQEQLAEKTKVTVRTIQRLEKGEVAPHLRTVKMLAAALDIEVDDLNLLAGCYFARNPVFHDCS